LTFGQIRSDAHFQILLQISKIAEIAFCDLAAMAFWVNSHVENLARSSNQTCSFLPASAGDPRDCLYGAVFIIKNTILRLRGYAIIIQKHMVIQKA
jgi:hypothetical protein